MKKSPALHAISNLVASPQCQYSNRRRRRKNVSLQNQGASSEKSIASRNLSTSSRLSAAPTGRNFNFNTTNCTRGSTIYCCTYFEHIFLPYANSRANQKDNLTKRVATAADTIRVHLSRCGGDIVHRHCALLLIIPDLTYFTCSYLFQLYKLPNSDTIINTHYSIFYS